MVIVLGIMAALTLTLIAQIGTSEAELHTNSPSNSPFKASHELTIGIDIQEIHKLSDYIKP